MAQSGYTPILIYASSTPGALPSAANLTSSASGAELAINYADGKLYFKNSSGVVTLLAGSSSGPAGGSNTQVQYNSSGVLAGSSNMTFDGTSLTLGGNPTLSAGTANGVLYLNGSKVATSGSALTFDGTTATVNSGTNNTGLVVSASSSSSSQVNIGVGVLTAGRPFVGTNTNTNPLEIGTRAAADTVFVVNSTEQMRLTSTGLKSSIAGTNADPVFSYTSDTNTGIFFPAADKLGFTAGGGTDQMVLTTTGLGIGTSSPGAKLHTQTAIGGTQGIVECTSGSSYLQVKSNNSAAVDAALMFTDGTNTSYFGAMRGSSGGVTGALQAYTGGAIRMTLDTSGNLGLGVTPSGWGSTYRAIDIASGANGGAALSGFFSTNIARNAYNDGTNWRAKYTADERPALYVQPYGGGHEWFNGNAFVTAGGIVTMTQAMTLDASGNLQIGSISNAYKLGVNGDIYIQPPTGTTNALLRLNNTGGNAYVGLDSNSGGLGGAYTLNLWHGGNYPIVFATNNTERARITSDGNLLVGVTTVAAEGGFTLYPQGSSGAPLLVWNRASTTNTTTAADFRNASTSVGNITYTNTATAYNTSSDYRLKDNPQPLTGSGAFIDALKPKTWNWKANGSKGVGFIAHEVQKVSPGSVVGEKDGEQMQAMEYGSAEFIANIIAELQSLRQRVALLEGN